MASVSPSAPARFVITGPTGWIGSALLALLHREGDPDALAEGESVALFGSRERTIQVSDGPELPVRLLADLTAEDVGGAHVVHLAYLTKDKLNHLTEEEFRRGNTAIDDAVIDAANEMLPASIFVASSGAARQAEAGRDTNPYGLTKLEQEARFLAFARSNGVPVLCGRIFNLAGPHINKLGDYAVSNFVVQALDTRCIRIEANQLVFRSILHVEDLCRMIVRAARQLVSEGRPSVGNPRYCRTCCDRNQERNQDRAPRRFVW
jgi:nucleoside-diphosphate-sugar epimerase